MMLKKKKRVELVLKGLETGKVLVRITLPYLKRTQEQKTPPFFFYTLAYIVDLFLIQCTLVGFSLGTRLSHYM